MKGELIASWDPRFECLFHGASAQGVYREIKSIGDTATAEQIVEKARDEATELHKCFTWDNDAAAEKWRKQEARTIVHHLIIRTAESDDEVSEPVRIFHLSGGVDSESNEEERGYRSIEFTVRNDDEYQRLLQSALSELLAFQRKYSILKNREELTRLIEAVEELSKTA